MRRLGFAVGWLAAFGFSSVAFGLESKGVTIPVIADGEACLDGNVQQCLDDAEGDHTIEALDDGDVTPEVFDPRCNLSFHLLARGAGYKNVFGWYNVVVDPDDETQTLVPELQDLHSFLLPNDDAPLDRTLALKNDPAYEGGLIGFFIATGDLPEAEEDGPPSNFDNLFYSELAHNPDSAEADPSVHLIIWQSVTYRDAFYFGWEDKLTDNDNDFQDIFTRVDGIQCAGGGEECDTGLPGVCEEGSMQCQQGELACVPDVPASGERCNALDDDCDGEVDNADGICPEDHLCDHGKCVPLCGGGEFQCATGFACNDLGACVDPDCEGVECPAGQVCEGGDCIDGCQDVTCPYGEVCRNGTCVDLCVNIECDDGFSCSLGVCVDCDCQGCEDGFVCSNDVCIEDSCDSVSCDEGSHCESGDCIEDCEDVACPGGAACKQGECQAPNGVDTSGSGGSSGNGSGNGDGGTDIDIDPMGSGGTDGQGGGDDLDTKDDGDTGGCGCRLATGSSGLELAAWLGFVGIAAARIRRRGRRAA